MPNRWAFPGTEKIPETPEHVMPDWYLVHTKSKKEASVQSQLNEWLPEVLLPTVQVHVRRWGKLVPSIAPLFPCYVFALMGISSDYAGNVRFAVEIE
jgi:transcription antitermination factor NusG